MPELYTVGAQAQAAGLNVETIRYYQRRGLVEEPPRPLGGTRRYGDAHARRLRFIKQAQRLGFSLNEVADLPALEDGRHCREAERLGSRKLAMVREHLAQLRKTEGVLAEAVTKCHSQRSTLLCRLIAQVRRVQSANGDPDQVLTPRSFFTLIDGAIQ